MEPSRNDTSNQSTNRSGAATNEGSLQVDVPRPRQLLEYFTEEYRLASYWRKIDGLRVRRPKLGGWPDWCFYPTRMAVPLLHRAAPELRPIAARISALAAWRATQGIYRYDATFFDELWNTPITGDIPAELLYRLPEWCVYIEVGRDAPRLEPGNQSDYLHGVFAYLDIDFLFVGAALCLVLDYEGKLTSISLPLGATLEESLARTEDIIKRTLLRAEGSPAGLDIDFRRARQVLEPLLSLTLYLCSTEPDLADVAGSGRTPSHAPVQLTRRKGTRRRARKLQVATQPTRWDVGYRIGAAIRRARRDPSETGEAPAGTRPSPIGHIRRAHWHTYWVGPRSEPEQRKRVLKWLPPIPVNLDDVDDLIPTVRPVEP